ncbi:PREDICTED: uncharacterized protein LOC109582138 [Amphimedon queenslandica]|uniref:Uncharacterized protein n=2 Tax=Amphimedon queenslandica TaxID=400682 RepID=A0AAN0J6H0_AMPQE|nr:PREDICTED: uncharacterized protein LOC109582138 [Amphimedon queenslandica]|eukprot:XP_019852316.1 PREDICTED: uncharacterized protein LOC109582138 [Amphimedon queenslandica]
MTPTSSSPSTPSSDDGDDNTIAIVLSVVFVSFIIIIIVVVVFILAVYYWRKKTKGHFEVPQEPLPLPSVPQESGVPSELGKYVIITAPMPSKNMGDSIAMQPMLKGPNSDNHEAADNSTTCRTFSGTETTVVKTETNKEQGDIETPISYDTIAEEQKESIDTEKTITTEANEGGATKEPIYTDLAPSTGTKLLPKTEVASVEYADIESVRPKSKVPPVQSYDDVVVSASGTTVIGATGGDTNPPPIPDKKSNGATTTGQEGTNGGTDAAQDSSHAHDHHDTVIDETQARTPSDITMVTGKENLTIIVKAPVQLTNPSPGSSSKNFLIPRRSSIPERSFLSTAAVSTDSKPPAKSEDKESEMPNVLSTTEKNNEM